MIAAIGVLFPRFGGDSNRTSLTYCHIFNLFFDKVKNDSIQTSSIEREREIQTQTSKQSAQPQYARAKT